MRLALPYRYLAVTAALLAIVVFNWIGFFVDVSRVGTHDDNAFPAAETSGENATESGVMAWFRKTPTPRSRIIAEQNIFSPLRREWVSLESSQAQAQGQEGGSAFAPAGKPRDDVELRGIVVVGGERRAILRLLATKPERIVSLAEGQGTDGKGGEPGPALTLVRIEDEYVLVRDEPGTIFQIGLFDHRRVPQPVKAPEVKVLITPLPKAPEASKVIAPDGGRKGGKPAEPSPRPASRKVEAKG
jgi:hypothetical protein